MASKAAILAVDLGTSTGWDLRTADGQTVSCTQNLKPGRFKSNGIPHLSYCVWPAEALAAIVASAQDWSKAQTVGSNQHKAKAEAGPTILPDHLATVAQRAAESGASLRTQKVRRSLCSEHSEKPAECTGTTKHCTTATMNVDGQQKTSNERSKAASAGTQVESDSTPSPEVGTTHEVESDSTPVAANRPAGPFNDSEAGALALHPGSTLLAASSGTRTGVGGTEPGSPGAEGMGRLIRARPAACGTCRDAWPRPTAAFSDTKKCSRP